MGEITFNTFFEIIRKFIFYIFILESEFSIHFFSYIFFVQWKARMDQLIISSKQLVSFFFFWR